MVDAFSDPADESVVNSCSIGDCPIAARRIGLQLGLDPRPLFLIGQWRGSGAAVLVDTRTAFAGRQKPFLGPCVR